MMKQEYPHLTRQLDIIPVERLSMPVTIIGCGAIGSFAALSLAKMGMTNMAFWDHDTISIENMSNQFYRMRDLNKNKALALTDLIEDFTGLANWPVGGRFVPEDNTKSLQGIVVVAVDDMAVRKRVFERVCAEGMDVQYIIDPRMSAEFYTQYCIRPGSLEDCAMYQKTLYSNEEAVAEACTAKSTVYTAGLAAGLITKTVKNILAGDKYPRNIQWDIKASQNPMLMYASGGL